MTKTKWTPGPWSSEVEECVKVRGTDKALIATCNSATLRYVRDQETVAANAHLIAAAPDLYAWLERCLAMVEHGAGPPNWDGIRTALAKARGEKK